MHVLIYIMYVYVCIYVCITCTYVCMYTCTYACMYVYMNVCMYVCTVRELLYSKHLTYMHFNNVIIIAHCVVYQPLLSTTIIVNNHVV